jgi:predicted P-loop ATPase
MRGKVLLEVNELRGFKSRDAAEIKSFLTSEFEEYRSLYTEETRQRRRRCVFVGTTNDDQFLVDETGHRRFLPMWVGAHQDVDAVRRDRDQLWAEAVSIFEHSGVLYRDAEELAKGEHQHFVERDEWLPLIHTWIEQTWPKSDQASAPLTTTLILRMAIGIFELAHHTTQHVTRVKRIMKRLGYTSTRDYGEVGYPYVWKKAGGGR